MVHAPNNPQMRLYALGAYDKFSSIVDFDTVKATIHQPRLDHVSTETLSVAQLVEWAEETVAPQAKKAYAGEGKYVVGDHCQFCKAAATCKARAEMNLELAKHEFTDVDLLDNDAVAKILNQSQDLTKWIKEVEKFALNELLEGREIPGYKLVEGRSIRRVSDADALVESFKKEGIDEALLFERKLLGITALERIVGKKKFEELTADSVIKPKGRPTLAPESDKRPDYNEAELDFVEIEKKEK